LSKPLASYHAIPRGLGSILASSILFYWVRQISSCYSKTQNLFAEEYRAD
jgi:hypothetical protein